MLSDRLTEDLKDAMRKKDRVRLLTIRSIQAALKEKEIEQRQAGSGEISDDDAIAVMQKQAKQRRDAIEQYEAAGREDLASSERAELEIIEAYLPKQLSDDELRAIVRDVIAETGASSPKDMGRVMGKAVERTRGVADGKRVSAVARELLSEA